MNNLIKLIQHADGDVSLTVYRGASRYTQRLTPQEARELYDKLEEYATAYQDKPFYLLRK
jgi:hypothetical protein